MNWDNCYRTKETPWDRGEPAPPLVEFSERFEFTGLRALVPGCGMGHDAAFLAKRGADVLGVDLSKLAIEKARSLAENFAGKLSFQVCDFLEPSADLPLQAFDLILEHTCFCAIDPSRRHDYVHAANRILKPNGKLLGIFFTHLEDPGDPPFATPPDTIASCFQPHFEFLEVTRPSRSFPGREGEESVYLMQKKATTRD